MARLARWSFAHRRRVVPLWILALAAAAGVSAAAGSSFNTNLSLPDTDSQAAVTLLTANFPAAAGEGDQIVIQATDGSPSARPGAGGRYRGPGPCERGAGRGERREPLRPGRGSADQPFWHHRLCASDLGQADSADNGSRRP